MASTFESRFSATGFPDAYQRHLVPRSFSPWGEFLVAKAGVAAGDRVLDVATGPGTVARIAARKAGPKGRVTGADFSAPMLAVAKGIAASPDHAPIEWVESPAAPLKAESAAYDVVVCQQGLQFFPDREAAIVEMVRALKPGGWLGLGVWATIERNPINHAVNKALAGCDATLATRQETPFSWHAPDELRVMMQEAGLTEVMIETHSIPLVFEGGAEQVVEVWGRSGLNPDISALPPEMFRRFEKALIEELRPLREPRGSVRAPAVSNIAIGRKPA